MKALIIGHGHAGRQHARAYDALGIGYDAVDDQQTAVKLASRRQTYNLASICSPDQYHADHVIRCLKSNIHVFCEKPLCLTRDELHRIGAAYIGSDAQLSCNLLLRTSAEIQKLKTMFEAGEIRPPFSYFTSYIKHRPIEGTWREHPNYRALLAGGIHMLDAALWCMDRTPTKVIGNPTGNTPASMLSNHVFSFDAGIDLSVITDLSNFESDIENHHRIDVDAVGFCLREHLKDGNQLSQPDMLKSAIGYFMTGKSDLAPTAREVFNLMSICFDALKSDEVGEPVEILS